MAWTRRLVAQESLFTAVTFTAACYGYYVVAVWGLQDYMMEGSLRTYLTSPAVHLELLVIGLRYGALIGADKHNRRFAAAIHEHCRWYAVYGMPLHS